MDANAQLRLITSEGFMGAFTLQQAINLMGQTVLDVENPKPGIARLGVVVGLLEINDEIEVVIRMIDHVTQVTKTEFETRFEVVSDT